MIEQQCIEGFDPDRPSVVALGSLTPPPPDTLPPIALLDLTNPRAPQQLCTYHGLPPWQVRLIGLTNLSYAASLGNGGNPSNGVIGTFDVSRVSNTTVVRWQKGGFGAGTFAWSSDGTLAYILATEGTESLTAAGSWELHVVRQGQDRILTTLPGVGGRGIGENDDTFLAFSPDGKYLALETTFTGPSQVGAAADGSLVKALPQGSTMAVWAANSLFYRDQAGVHRWDASGTTSLVLPGVSWIRPRASPDGKWIVYSVRDSTGLHHVNLYNVFTGSGFPLSSGGRTGGIFLSPTVIWEREERLCTASDSCGMLSTVSTGVAYTYDLASRQETRSVISAITDVWPRMD